MKRTKEELEIIQLANKLKDEILEEYEEAEMAFEDALKLVEDFYYPEELDEDSVAIHWLSYEDGQTAKELFDRVMKYIDERGCEGD